MRGHKSSATQPAKQPNRVDSLLDIALRRRTPNPPVHRMDAYHQSSGSAPTRVNVIRHVESQGEPSAPAPVPEQDWVASEEPLEIRVDTQPVAVTMRTPGHDSDLAVGFLLTEGLLQSFSDIRRIQPHPRNEHGNVIDVQLQPHVHADLSRLTRHVFTSSSCGLCGRATLDAVHQNHPPLAPLTPELTITPELLLQLPERMRLAQPHFSQTGGLHAAALFDPDGTLLCLREDVGRHNAVDKVLGSTCLSGSWPPDRSLLLVSGRISFEIVQKALAARIPILAAVSAPSSLAIQLADSSHMTLVGFLRPGRFNIYSQPQRIADPSIFPSQAQETTR